ncbi:hypothetical protein [Streptomyces sp. NBC_00009]|uniref:hypothetical protein n=1 Tax=Streptomyces sp. NBC_00009 TaxID=2975620 RepID=UPI0032534946
MRGDPHPGESRYASRARVAVVVTQDLGDPKAPSNRSVILQPDKSVTGGMKIVRQAQQSEVAKGYTPSVA